MDGVVQQAFADYQSGMKYKDIAEKYGVSLSAVKSWASRYWKKEGCNQKEKKLQLKQKKVATRGGQPGNKNATGHGGTGPPGNKNAVTTGEFETLFFDTLDPDEKKLINMVQPDKEQLLLQEIQLLTVRERRMMKRIEDLKLTDSEQVEIKADGMTPVKYKLGTEKSKWTDLVEYTGTMGQIQSVENALTRVQAQKQKTIDALHRFGFDDARLEIEIMKVELAMLKENTQESDIKDDGFMAAMNAEASEIWGDEDD
ncbi:MAG: phage terminase small subunit [Clostridium sp.]